MTFSPGTFFVNASGCFLDWLITRAWGRVMLLAIPGSIGLTVLGMSIWGSMLDTNKLAAWYLDIGDKELENIDGNWAFGGKEGDAKTQEGTAAGSSTDKNKDSGDNGKSDEGGAEGGETADDGKPSVTQNTGADEKAEVTIPRFAEAVFRRAQQLEPLNKRIVIVVAALMSQRGSFAQAMAILRPFAPEDKEGFAPAHALMANLMLQQPVPNEQLPVLQHHISIAPKWDRTPPGLLVAAAQLAARDLNNTRAMGLLKQAAEIMPAINLEVLGLARSTGNTREAEAAAKKAEAYFRDRIAKGEDSPRDRLALVQILATPDASEEALDEATRIMEEGLQRKESSELRRGLSEIWRLRFSRTVKLDEGSSWTGDLRLLDHALKIDPTNPGIAEEVAKLARLGGDRPTEALMQKLRDILTQGTATPLTHVWLSEAHILRGEYKDAIYHLNQVVARMPNAAARYRNNLAFAIALAFPDQLETALAHAKVAVTMEPQTADFRDTLGFVLLKMNKVTDAITQLEIAIELAPRQNPPRPRPDFHQRLAEAYKLEGNDEMAQSHLKLADELTKTLVIQPSPTTAALDDISNSQTGVAPPADDTSTIESPPASNPDVPSSAQVESATPTEPAQERPPAPVREAPPEPQPPAAQ